VFRFTQPIRFSHCDPAGVLYFPHVFDFVNAAMEDWFAQRLGLPFHVLHLELRRGNPVVRTRCEFVTPCRFGETLALDLEPIAVGHSSIETRLSGAVRARTARAILPAAAAGRRPGAPTRDCSSFDSLTCIKTAGSRRRSVSQWTSSRSQSRSQSRSWTMRSS
jgi:acyl-CoA thioesterase FadM